MVELQLPKLAVRVRFPLPAPNKKGASAPFLFGVDPKNTPRAPLVRESGSNLSLSVPHRGTSSGEADSRCIIGFFMVWGLYSRIYNITTLCVEILKIRGIIVCKKALPHYVWKSLYFFFLLLTWRLCRHIHFCLTKSSIVCIIYVLII